MKNKLNIIIGVLFSIVIFSQNSYSQTEGFEVKTPIQMISDSTISFLNNTIQESENNPKESINGDIFCKAKCIFVIPNIELVESRGDFTGTGLLSCRKPNSESWSEPLFYQINNLESFEEDSGGLIILVTDKPGIKAILGYDVHLGSDNTGPGPIGDAKSGDPKSFVSYVKYKDQALSGIDLTGSLLEYSSKDTLNAYQAKVIPVEIFIEPQDVPPMLREYDTLLKTWAKSCN